ncbi:hypothetical protein PPYR_06638 [Photinus pyralis]|uniref:Uncharacterized protein n=2 Tax=Photinus pyralis TaxID=7054 RepID=A0A5N4ANF7_PHOPY|nr:uncharacterized protein LOC116169306 [Photinus pyralis]KAB0798758.1 hypothetical protein PPYR_06638 [Photinus pyralis]
MTITIFIALLIVAKIRADCVIDFDIVEKGCAKPLDLSPTIVFYYLTRGYAYVDVPKVQDFVTCTWRKWGYENLDGSLNYDKMRSDKMLPWKLARHCNEFPEEYKAFESAFRKTVTDCERKPPPSPTAEGTRLCINSNYTKYIPNM